MAGGRVLGAWGFRDWWLGSIAEARADAGRQDWFVADEMGDDFPDEEFDETGDQGRGRLGDRLPRMAGPQLGPALVTLVVLCAAIILVVSSVIWHPHVN